MILSSICVYFLVILFVFVSFRFVSSFVYTSTTKFVHFSVFSFFIRVVFVFGFHVHRPVSYRSCGFHNMEGHDMTEMQGE